MRHAINIPMDDCGLSINVGTDGVWLHFRASTGKSVSINTPNLVNGGLIGQAMIDWCLDREHQAREIASAAT